MRARSTVTGVTLILGAWVSVCAPGAVTVRTVGAVRSAAADTMRIPPLPIPYQQLIPRPRPADAERGLEFLLVEVTPSPATGVPRTSELHSEILDPSSTAQLLARLPALPDTATSSFRFPAAAAPPPRTGALIHTSFPLDTPDRPAAAAPEAGQPLEVVRIAPTGETELAPQLIITFNQAMVPLTTIVGTEARQPPARLSPEPPGRWTWLDTRTVRFEPAGRFPMATEYDVEVPAGTRSATGRTLAEAVKTRFATPAPRAVGGYPALDPDSARRRSPGFYEQMGAHAPASVALQPIILIVFDQDITAERVLAATRLTANGIPHRLRLATAEEVAADTVVEVLANNAEAQRWVAFRPADPLPRNADVRVIVAPGAVSAEGPRMTGSAQELRFRTYAPLEIVGQRCWSGAVCPPDASWTIQFNNPLDTAASSRPQLRIEPALPDMVVRIDGSTLSIAGQRRPNTRYRVTVEGGVQDRFGQTLGRPPTLTFSVQGFVPFVSLGGVPMIVLDPSGPPRVRLHTRGNREVEVRVYRVTPEQWPEYARAVDESRTGRVDPPGQRVLSETLRIDDGAAFTEQLIDIGPALQQGVGHAVVVVQARDAGPSLPFEERRERPIAFVWVQATRIGMSAKVTGSELLGWASSLETGQPLGGVELRLVPSRRRAVTAADGTAVLELGSTADAALVARQGHDSALLPQNEHGARRGYGWQWQRHAADRELRWLLFSDRGLYRPGETVHIKGWLRELPFGRRADLMLPTQVTSLSYRGRGPRGEELGAGELRPGPLGGFHTSLQLPEELSLGHAQLRIEPQPGTYVPGHLELRVQEFRRPDYEVTQEVDPGPHVIRDVVDLALSAKYYGGGGLGGAQVDWRLSSAPATYAPPGWDRWRFGRAPAWWLASAGHGTTQTLAGTTDATGSHRIRAELLAVDPPFATLLHAEAQVQDVSRQVGSARTTLLVHPAALNVGLRPARAWVRAGDTVTVGIVVVDHAGRTVPGRRIELVRERLELTWSLYGPTRAQATSEAVVCDVASGSEPASCTVTFTDPAMYRLRADVGDDVGRISRTEVILWVPGGPAPAQPRAGRFEVTADRAEYLPGDTARIALAAPFFPAEGLLTVRRFGVIASERFRVTSATHELRVPITETYLSGVQVHVELVDARRATRAATGETTLAVSPQTRALDVTIVPRDSVVAPGAETVIDVRAADAAGRAAAGAEVALWMVDEAVLAVGNYTLPDPLGAFYPARRGPVRDHAMRQWVIPWPRSEGPNTIAATVFGYRGEGMMVGATVRLEGTDITSVTGYDGGFILRDVAPGEYVLRIEARDGSGRRLRVVVPAEGIHLGNVILRATGVTEEPGEVVAVAPPPPGQYLAGMQVAAADMRYAVAQEVEVRSDFSALAVFEPSTRTDANGRAQVRVRLPGSLTRYRVMAVAVSGPLHFGTGEATVTARKALMARLNAPRFLNYGDRFELPVLVQNSTMERLETSVAVRGAGLRFTDGAARRVVLPPGERAEVRFAATALRAGTARMQVIAVAGDHTDAARVDIPIYTPATTEAFATYGVIDTGAPVLLPVSRPRAVIREFGGLEIGIASTALHALTDAVLYLHTYPFECVEQLSSRLLAVAALRDVLAAFAAEQLPAPEAIVASARHDIARLADLQNDDGGWGFWYAGEPSNPFVTTHAAHALARAAAEGFAVRQDVVERALSYLQRVDTSSATWPLRERHSLRAYALYVRHLLNDAAAAVDAHRIASTPPDRVGGELPVEAAAWLLNVLASRPSMRAEAAELRRYILNRVSETAGGATFTERYSDGAHLLLHSQRRTDAVVLDALIAADPTSDLVPKLANFLLAHRVRGRWSSTQENAWALLALNRYFRTYEATTPDFQSGVWLAGRFAGGHTFSGRTTERQHIGIPMPELLRADTSALLIARHGEGRMYYRAGLRYASTDLRPDALDRGFMVSRSYEAVDDTADVRRDTAGTWHVRPGARVRVRVIMVAPSVRSHVALVDPLPAGFEPLNPELRGTGFTDVPQPRPEPRRRSAQEPRPSWFVHQNLRDDRAEAFATLLPAGVFQYSYLARATTPGVFVVPPARAEMMYEPETFGRGTADTVRIEAPTASR